MSPYAEVAVAFASALVEGDFARAESLLAPEIRQELTRDVLREKFYDMFRGYSDGKPRAVHFDEEFEMEAWPGKQPGDIGWAYVGIEGDDFLEAVAVIVAAIGGQYLIRQIEWGRP